MDVAACLNPNTTQNRGFMGGGERLSGQKGSQGSPACRAAISHQVEAGRSPQLCLLHHAHKFGLSTKCAYMHGNTNASLTWNLPSINI